jgi:CheY-like chemotaxis protein
MERVIEQRGFGKTVLVVDDSAVIRKALVLAFMSDGFKTCIEVENGKEAIEAAKGGKPDLIILDLSMPVMNGLQSAPELRKILPRARIILFTLYGPTLTRAEASAAGIDLVLDKSTPLKVLMELAHDLLDRSG